VFPFLNRKMDFSEEQEQHKLIHSTLDALSAKLRAAKAEPTAFNAAELKETFVNFREPLVGLVSCSRYFTGFDMSA
jgi:hypothetical protein